MIFLGLSREAAMASYRHAKCNDQNFTIWRVSSNKFTIRTNDGMFVSTGTKIGEASRLEDANTIIKKHSGGKSVDLGYWH